MRFVILFAASAAIAGSAEAQQGSSGVSAPATSVIRAGSGAPTPGPATNFTGQVTVRSPFSVGGDSDVGGATVSFAPGARTAWHSHPRGQTLVVTEGCGWTQAWGGKVEQICAGDMAWIGPGQLHWHGATPSSAMTHVAISESAQGQSVVWREKVTDAEYRLAADSKP